MKYENIIFKSSQNGKWKFRLHQKVSTKRNKNCKISIAMVCVCVCDNFYYYYSIWYEFMQMCDAMSNKRVAQIHLKNKVKSEDDDIDRRTNTIAGTATNSIDDVYFTGSHAVSSLVPPVCSHTIVVAKCDPRPTRRQILCILFYLFIFFFFRCTHQTTLVCVCVIYI